MSVSGASSLFIHGRKYDYELVGGVSGNPLIKLPPVLKR